MNAHVKFTDLLDEYLVAKRRYEKTDRLNITNEEILQASDDFEDTKHTLNSYMEALMG